MECGTSSSASSLRSLRGSSSGLARLSRRRTLILLSLLALGGLSAAGCGSTLFIRRTVYVSDASPPVRLREPVQAKVWVLVDGKWEPSEMTLPEGWYAGFVPPDAE